MQIQPQPKVPMIYLRQYAIQQNTFTPLSAFLSLCGLLIPFTQTPNTIIPFLLILSPLYINRKSYTLCISLVLVALLWPLNDQAGKGGNSWIMRMDQNDVVMRILLLVDAIYMMVSFRKPGKYKMTPSQVENNHFPILL